MVISTTPIDVEDQSLITPEGLSWFPVPDRVKHWLALASAHWHDPDLADSYMDQALASAPNHPDVLVSAYRYFFYTHNYPRALQVATQVLTVVKQEESLPADWSTLKPLLQERQDHPMIRLYINAYAATGLIRARLGELEVAKSIAVQVSEIESRNEFGGKVVRDILDQPDDDD